MIMVLFTIARACLGGLTLRGWMIGAAAIAAALWSGYLYSAGYSAADARWKARNLEVALAQVKADLAANEALRRQAEADARASEQDEQRLKELIDALPRDKSCPLSRSHVDGLRRIDTAP
jgi:hypothetical protein